MPHGLGIVPLQEVDPATTDVSPIMQRILRPQISCQFKAMISIAIHDQGNNQVVLASEIPTFTRSNCSLKIFYRQRGVTRHKGFRTLGKESFRIVEVFFQFFHANESSLSIHNDLRPKSKVIQAKLDICRCEAERRVYCLPTLGLMPQ